MEGAMSQAITSSDLRPGYWDEASAQLMRRDRILRRLIPRHAQDILEPASTPFMSLARAIVSQQVSTASANAIWARFVGACGRRPAPAKIAEMTPEQLRELGVSRRKGEYIVGLASAFAEKRLRPSAWQEMDDEAIIAELCQLRGIGRWTAEMFLIFSLGRPDVLPLDDAGLLKAISLHYFSGEPVSRFEAREVAQAWAPWRTVATWYLWRSLAAPSGK